MTVEFDFVQLHESPSPSSRVIASVPKGDYEVTDIEEIDWAGQTQQWFEITAEGRTGWVRDDPIFAGQKSAECP